MQKVAFALAFYSSVLICNAQQYNTITYKAGEDLIQHKDYLFPAFTTGTVNFKAGGSQSYKMNFSTLTCKIEFINPAGDTLSVSKPGEFSSVQIDSSTFYFVDGNYIEVIAASDNIRLAVLRKVSFESVKIGAMGLRDKNHYQVDYTSLLSSQGTNKLTLDEDIDVKKKTTYVIILSDGSEMAASKSNFIKLFKSRKTDTEDFIKHEKINFYSTSDLKKLFLYCTSSTAKSQ